MKKLKFLVDGSSLIKSILVLSPSLLLAGPFDSSSIKSQNAPYNQALQTMESKAEDKLMMKSTTSAAVTSSKEAAVIMIEAQTRATDIKEAFTTLSQYKGSPSIYMTLSNNEKITNITELSLTKGGSIIIVKMNTTQGQKYKVIKVEDINSLDTD